MARRLSSTQINRIKELRSRGFSLPEISRKLKIGQGTTWRHIHGVRILDEYKKVWLEKRRPSVKRRVEAVNKANALAQGMITGLSNKEKLLVLASLYWAEGAKVDFNLTNSDPKLIKVFVKSLNKVLDVPKSRLRLNVRIYEDMDKKTCVNFWLKLTGLGFQNLSSVNILKGKKKGKLKYGLCRIRVTKGGDMLKYMVALRQKIVEEI